MPFRKRQELQFYAAGKIFYSVGSPNADTGIVEYKDVPQQAKLPDVGMTDLASCLKAGVPLEKVSCKLISPDTKSLLEKISSETNSNSNSKNED